MWHFYRWVRYFHCWTRYLKNKFSSNADLIPNFVLGWYIWAGQFIRFFSSHFTLNVQDPMRVVDRTDPAKWVLSMPAELVRGFKIKPNREIIRQILETNSILELQRQLLTTVMENEVDKSIMYVFLQFSYSNTSLCHL